MRHASVICFAVLIGLSAGGTALADNVTFAANGSFDDGASLGGTLVIDTGTGDVQSNGIDLTVVGGQAGSPGLVFDTLSGSGLLTAIDGAGDNLWDMNFTDSTFVAPPQTFQNPVLQLEIFLGSNTSLAGFTGGVTTGNGSLCFYDAANYPNGDNCGYYFSSYNLSADPNLTGGSLSVAGAPEPASIWLLAVPAVWVFRRRKTV